MKAKEYKQDEKRAAGREERKNGNNPAEFSLYPTEKQRKELKKERQKTNLLELNSKSSIKEACEAYAEHNATVKQALRDGKKRAADPYYTIARGQNGGLKIEDISKRWAKLFQMMLADKSQSSATVNGILTKYANVFGWLEELEIVEKNPFEGLKRIPKTPKKRETRELTAEEYETAHEYLKGIKPYKKAGQGIYADVWEFATLTAMRLSEITKVETASINGDILTIDAGTSKTRKARIVVLSPRALEIVNKWKKEEGKVFELGTGAIQMHLFNLTKKTGTSYFMHLTRHTGITKYARDGEAVSITELMAYSGHTSIEGVSYYLHIDSEKMREKVRNRLKDAEKRSMLEKA